MRHPKHGLCMRAARSGNVQIPLDLAIHIDGRSSILSLVRAVEDESEIPSAVSSPSKAGPGKRADSLWTEVIRSPGEF